MPKTILIADDSESIRTILRLSLQFKGYNIVEVENGKDAYEKLKESQFDLLIADVSMPNMSGLELTTKIRGELKNEQLPIIICTAEKNIKEEDIISRGANRLLRKPFSPRELLEVVGALSV